MHGLRETHLVRGDCQPFVLMRDLHISPDGTHRVDKVGIGTGDKGRNLDTRKVDPLVLPVLVLRLGSTVHLEKVLDAAFAPNDVRRDEVEQPRVERATTNKLFSVEIGACLPRGDTLEGRRLLRSNVPLNNSQVGVSSHADVPGAPWLLGNALDHIIPVFPFLNESVSLNSRVPQE